MNFSIRHRIEKLEAVDTRRTIQVMWRDGTGSAEHEIARLGAAGELDVWSYTLFAGSQMKLLLLISNVKFSIASFR